MLQVRVRCGGRDIDWLESGSSGTLTVGIAAGDSSASPPAITTRRRSSYGPVSLQGICAVALAVTHRSIRHDVPGLFVTDVPGLFVTDIPGSNRANSADHMSISSIFVDGF